MTQLAAKRGVKDTIEYWKSFWLSWTVVPRKGLVHYSQVHLSCHLLTLPPREQYHTLTENTRNPAVGILQLFQKAYEVADIILVAAACQLLENTVLLLNIWMDLYHWCNHTLSLSCKLLWIVSDSPSGSGKFCEELMVRPLLHKALRKIFSCSIDGNSSKC